MGERKDRLLVAHPKYLALGADPVTRVAVYRALFEDALPDALVAKIHLYLQQQKALGSDRFVPGSRQERAASQSPCHSAGRRGIRIVPDTFSR